MENKKGVSGKALKKTLEYVKENHNRLSAIENVDVNSFTCENVITTVPDNVTNNIKLTSVQGKTLQNLVIDENFRSAQTGTVTIEGDYATLISLNDGYTNSNVICEFSSKLLKPNTIYTLILKEVEAPYVSLRDYNNSVYLLDSIDIKSTNMKRRFTTPENVGTTFHFYFRSMTVGQKAKITNNIMILEGDWTNKETPAYFEGIQSVQNPIDVQVTGKNIFDFSNLSLSSTNAYTNEIIGDNKLIMERLFELLKTMEGTTVRLSCESTGNLVGGSNPIGTLRFFNGNTSLLVLSPNKETVIPHLDTFDKCYVYLSDTGATAEKYQLEVGTTATAYEPYKQQYNYKLPFDGELRSLPNGVCDTIENGKLIRRVGKHTFTTTSKGTVLTANSTVNRISLDSPPNLGYATTNPPNNFICDTLPVINRDKLYIGEQTGISQYVNQDNTVGDIFVGIPVSICGSNTASFKTWLANNPITIYYELLVPEIIELETIYNNPIYHAYANGNIIKNNSPIQPILTFEYYTGMQGRILSLEEEVAELSDLVSEIDVIETWNKI